MNVSVPLLPSSFSWLGQGRHLYFCSILNFIFLRLCLGHSFSPTIHFPPSPFFFYRCVQTQCFLHKCNQNRSCLSPYSCFSPPRKIFRLCSPARVENALLPRELLKSTFVFLTRMCSKSSSPELTPKHHCSIHNLLKKNLSCPFF